MTSPKSSEAAHSKGRKGGRFKALTTDKLKKLKTLTKYRIMRNTEKHKHIEQQKIKLEQKKNRLIAEETRLKNTVKDKH